MRCLYSTDGNECSELGKIHIHTSEITLDIVRSNDANNARKEGEFSAKLACGDVDVSSNSRSVEKKVVTTEDECLLVFAPMIGTFYRSSAPDMSPYVDVGSMVEQESIVCVIEAMKLMNEISAGVAGEVAEVLVENGSMVEYGQPLFKINPA